MSTKQMVAVQTHFQLRDVQLCMLSEYVIEQCCFNSTPDPFYGQTVNFILKPSKVIESRTYVKKANWEHYSITLTTYTAADYIQEQSQTYSN